MVKEHHSWQRRNITQEEIPMAEEANSISPNARHIAGGGTPPKRRNTRWRR